MEYNVIATDLDGTLLTSNKKVTERTKNVLNILKKQRLFHTRNYRQKPIQCNKNLKTNTNKVVFFGDGENDLSIMKEVGLGVAMENSVPIIKQTAKERTLSNDEEGVAFFLEKYFLIADIK